jgi:hypothetical protein
MSSFEQQSALRNMLGVSFVFLILLAFVSCPSAFAQEGRLVREKVHGPALEKTVTGESADRTVSVYLPPSYDASPRRRYPVVYLLHGITDTDGTWIFPWTESGAPWRPRNGIGARSHYLRSQISNFKSRISRISNLGPKLKIQTFATTRAGCDFGERSQPAWGE